LAKQKYYVVWVGREPGIYHTWDECNKQVMGFSEPRYKSFGSHTEAETAFADGWQTHWGKKRESKTKAEQPVLFESDEEIDYDSISVDVGTRGNPGPIEYKGVDTKTNVVLFEVGPIENGTNNLGEFIAIVHALAYLKQNGSSKTVYSDSRTALAWLRNKQVGSTLKRDESTKKIWELTDRAIKWLNSNTYENKVLKWETERWGEIRADYGRK